MFILFPGVFELQICKRLSMTNRERERERDYDYARFVAFHYNGQGESNTKKMETTLMGWPSDLHFSTGGKSGW